VRVHRVRRHQRTRRWRSNTPGMPPSPPTSAGVCDNQPWLLITDPPGQSITNMRIVGISDRS
jgi:hypothetical protein